MFLVLYDAIYPYWKQTNIFALVSKFDIFFEENFQIQVKGYIKMPMVDRYEYYYAMLEDEQEEALLNEEEINAIINEYLTRPAQTSKSKLKDWRAYCKLRGKKSAQKEYSKDIQEVGSFNTLDDFFRIHSAIREPSQLEIDTKLMYFLEGCQPVWEDWLHSGCLLINIKFKDSKTDKAGADILNKIWEHLLFSLVGNSLPSNRLNNGQVVTETKGEEDIIGIILSRRDKISLVELWFRTQRNAAPICRLIQAGIWKELQSLGQNQKGKVQMRYKNHKDSYSNHSTMKGSYLLKTSLNDSF